MTSRKSKVPRWVWTAAKVAVAAAVVAWMFRKDLIQLDQLGRAGKNWPLLAAALAALLAGIFVQSIRWGVLVRAQGIHIGLYELFRLTMVGLFFTVIAPGGVGGDAVKAYYTARGQAKKTEAATTVFLDRFLGLATLFLVACVIVALDFGRLWNARLEGLDVRGLPGGRILVIIIAGCMAGMAGFSALVVSKRVRRAKWLAALSRWVPFRRVVGKVYDALHLYGDEPRAVLYATGISIVAQIPLYLIYYLFARAIGVEIELWHCALIVPPAMVIRVLPLLPGGAGQGMVAMSLLFPLVGVKEGGAIGAIGDALFVVVYLIGGLFFLFGKTSYSEMRAVAGGTAAPPGRTE